MLSIILKTIDTSEQTITNKFFFQYLPIDKKLLKLKRKNDEKIFYFTSFIF